MRKPPAHPTLLAPTSRSGKHMRATCQHRRARSDPLQAPCSRPGPLAHPRATMMRWASDNGEQHDQCASVARTPSPIMLARLPAPCARLRPPAHLRGTIMCCASENRELHDQSASLPRTQPCLLRLPALANTCALLASNDARVRIHFQQRSRDLDHPRTHAPPLCFGPVRAESSTTSAQASRAPNHACPDFPHWQTHARYFPATTRAFGSTSSNVRATWTTRAPTRHRYALGQ